MKLTYEERNIWWDAYCSALCGMHAFGHDGATYSVEGADKDAAFAAELALARWRMIRLNDEELSP